MEFNITNYKDHPVNSYYTVFFFREIEHSDMFEQLLTEKSIEFEKAEHEPGEKKFYFAVKNSDRKAAVKINYIVSAHFRKPFLPRATGWFLILLVVIVIAAAIIGYMASN